MQDASARRPALPVRLVPAACAVAFLGWVLLCVVLADAGWRHAALVPIGVAIGCVLLLADFGFANAFRALIEAGETGAFRAHLLMLAAATCLFFPLLAAGSIFGQPVAGFATPVGIAFCVGAALFGAGMQIAGGCASGTLFALGGGNARLGATLVFFVVGSTLAAWQMPFWWALPALPAVSLVPALGLAPALALQIGLIALLALAACRLDRARVPRRLLLGGVALAGLNALTLATAGQPWSETAAFALWGSKLLAASGLADPAGWDYWQGNPALSRSIFLDITSIMDLSIIGGALLAASFAGRFALRAGGGPMPWLGAAAGGLLMGYGARLANGCNIGAYFSAIASGSVSGWLWPLFGLAGSVAGVRLRPFFGLSVRRRGDGPAC